MLYNATVIFDSSFWAFEKEEDLKRLSSIDFSACSKLDRAIDDLPFQLSSGAYSMSLFLLYHPFFINSTKVNRMAIVQKLCCF